MGMLYHCAGYTFSRRLRAIAAIPDFDSVMGPPGTPGTVNCCLSMEARACGVEVNDEAVVVVVVVVVGYGKSPPCILLLDCCCC